MKLLTGVEFSQTWDFYLKLLMTCSDKDFVDGIKTEFNKWEDVKTKISMRLNAMQLSVLIICLNGSRKKETC